MPEYQPNSHSFKKEQAENKEAAQERKFEKVIEGTAKVKKKSEISKFKDVFISEDASNVKSYIFRDVFIPAAKKLISDIVRDGIDMILYGGRGGGGDRFANGSRASYISYNKQYDRRDAPRVGAPQARTRFEYEDIVFPSRGEAEFVRDQMEAEIARYGYVTIAAMYEMAGLPAPPYTSYKYGWINIRNSTVSGTRDGYIIKLPKAAPID